MKNENIIFDKWMSLVIEFQGDEKSAWFAITENDRKKIQEFRHSISVKINEFIAKGNLKKLGTDAAVPDAKFEELYFYSKELVENAKLNFVIYGHAGNSHMHLNMLPKDEAEYKTGVNIYGEICKKAVQLGGTISAEHGIGKLKTGYFLQMYGQENINKMIGIKKMIDPKMILGRGNIFNISR